MGWLKSDLVVISWWSNCLGLNCLHHLARHTRNRNIYVIQVGKREEQKDRFRVHLPPIIQELRYPPECRAEDWRVREVIARELLGERAGLWFIDHDLFVQEDCDGWLNSMDGHFDEMNVCLCHPSPRRGPSITNPAFWLSPVRFPPGMPGFARLPYQEDPVASWPYVVQNTPSERQSAGLIRPEKDTLVAAMEFLQAHGMVCGFPLTERDQVPGGPAPFPRHEHIGGLYTFAAGIAPDFQHDWVARCVQRFSAFYERCPQEWLETEDPVLLSRLKEFRQAVSNVDQGWKSK